MPLGFDVDRQYSCRTSFQSQVIQTSKQLRDFLSTKVSVGGGAFGVEFSASVGYEKETESLEQTFSTKVQSTATCKYYHAQLGLFKNNKPKFSSTFKQAIALLKNDLSDGKISNENAYFVFDNFGTHYLREALYGARYTNMFTMTSSDYSKMKREGIDVEVAASYSGAIYSGSASASVSTETQESVRKFNENTNRETYSYGSLPPSDGEAATWASAVKQHPLPIQYTLGPITDVFDPNIFEKINSELSNEDALKIKSELESKRTSYCAHVKNSNPKVYCSEAELPASGDRTKPASQPAYRGLTWPSGSNF